MFEKFTFVHVNGTRKTKKIQVLALSTCGFCRRGIDFLQELHFDFDYIHLDTLAQEVKNELKEEFKGRFSASLSYPALVIDGESHVIGFVKRVWEEKLGIDLNHVSEAEPVE